MRSCARTRWLPWDLESLSLTVTFATRQRFVEGGSFYLPSGCSLLGSEKVESAPEPVLLIITDISGYTGYMTANAKALAHGQALITELVTTILNQVELPLKVAKLEGDAVFLFARKQDSSAWPEKRKLVGEKLLRLLRGFLLR